MNAVPKAAKVGSSCFHPTPVQACCGLIFRYALITKLLKTQGRIGDPQPYPGATLGCLSAIRTHKVPDNVTRVGGIRITERNYAGSSAPHVPQPINKIPLHEEFAIVGEVLDGRKPCNSHPQLVWFACSSPRRTLSLSEPSSARSFVCANCSTVCCALIGITTVSTLPCSTRSGMS